jgi:hypothetical protein
MMDGRFPFLVIGEIVSATPPDENAIGNRWSYTVKVHIPYESYVTNAVMLESFSGPFSYFQVKPDVSGGINHRDTRGRVNTDKEFTRGSRCLVAFIGGMETCPVIVGMLPHPHSSTVIPRFMSTPSLNDIELDEEKIDREFYPAMEFRLNGVMVRITELGEIFLNQEGGSFVDSHLVGHSTKIGEESIRAGLLANGSVFFESGFTKLNISNSSASLNIGSSIISLAGRDSKSHSSDLRVSISGLMVVSSIKNMIFATDASLILNAAKGIDLYTDDKFNLEVMKTFDLKVTENTTVELKKDFLFKTIGKSTINLEDDVTLGAKKKLTATVGDALTLSVEKAFKTTVKDEYSVKSDKSMKLEGKDFLGADEKGAKLVLKGGKVALGNDQAELFDALYTLFDKILKGGAQFAIGAQGPAVIGPDVSTAVGEFLMALQKVKGSL